MSHKDSKQTSSRSLHCQFRYQSHQHSHGRSQDSLQNVTLVRWWNKNSSLVQSLPSHFALISLGLRCGAGNWVHRLGLIDFVDLGPLVWATFLIAKRHLLGVNLVAIAIIIANDAVVLVHWLLLMLLIDVITTLLVALDVVAEHLRLLLDDSLHLRGLVGNNHWMLLLRCLSLRCCSSHLLLLKE